MIWLHSLGQCVIQVGRSRIVPDAKMLFATALHLLVERGHPISRSALMALLWPDAEEAHAQHSLRQTLYKLKSLGFRFATEHAAIMLASKDVEVDYASLLGEHRPAALEALSENIAGPWLPGYAPRISAGYTEWLEQQRDVVHSALRRVLVAGIVAKRARGEWSAVEALAQQCLRLDPLNEEATLAMAEAAAMHGSKAYAITMIDRYLKEIGPEAREVRLPATALRRRITHLGREAPAPVGQAPFVGRAPEMAALNHALSLAVSGQGSAYLLWGEAGIGKSRLTTEFTKGASLQRVQVARVGCQSHDERRSLSAFVDLVPRLLELRGAIGCSPDSMKYLKRLTSHDPSATTLSPDAREAELLFSNIRRALFDLIDAIATEATVVLVIEDVHWLDPMSWEILRDLIPWLATRHVLSILTSRDRHADEQPGSRVITSLRRIHVGPLPDAAGRELLDAMLLHRAADPAFRDWCLHTSAGNPYYMSELAAHAIAEGDTYQVPVSLTALIAERLARLQPISRRVLQACAILGKNSTLERVETILAQARVDLLDSLDDLDRQGFIESDGARLVVKHELLAQAAVAELSNSARQLLHRHAAAALQAEGERTQASVLLWECAEHWNAAGETERAVQLLRSCAQHSLEMGVPGDAARILERALQLPVKEDDVLSLMREQAVALRLSGQWGQLLPVVERIMQLDCDPDCLTCHSADELTLIEAKWRNGFPLAELFEQLATCVYTSTAASAHRVRAATLAIMLADNLCYRDRAVAIYEAAEPCLDASDVDDSTRHYLQLVYHCAFGDLDLAVSAAHELIDRERAFGNPASLSRFLRYYAVVQYAAGHEDAAFSIAEEAFKLAAAHDLHGDAIAAAQRLAELSANSADTARTERWQAEAQRRCEFSSDQLVKASSAGVDAILYLRRGQYSLAEQSLTTAEKVFHISDATRSHVNVIAGRVALRLFRDGIAPSRVELDQFLQLHSRMMGYNDLDWPTYVLCRALYACELSDKAREVLESYIREHRRERSRLLPELEDLRHVVLIRRSRDAGC